MQTVAINITLHAFAAAAMSRAFVKESDGDTAGDLPERAVSDAPNYVTARGQGLLRARIQSLAEERAALAADGPHARRRAEIERDLRYFNAQLERAVVVDPALQPVDETRFGARVTLRDARGGLRVYHIVGEDEADAASGAISWNSPLARRLLGLRVGDGVNWPGGGRDACAELEITDIRYGGQQ